MRLIDEEHAAVTANIPDFPKTARATLEYGADKEGYWTGERFMANVKDAVKIAKLIYASTSHTVVWVLT